MIGLSDRYSHELRFRRTHGIDATVKTKDGGQRSDFRKAIFEAAVLCFAGPGDHHNMFLDQAVYRTIEQHAFEVIVFLQHDLDHGFVWCNFVKRRLVIWGPNLNFIGNIEHDLAIAVVLYNPQSCMKSKDKGDRRQRTVAEGKVFN